MASSAGLIGLGGLRCSARLTGQLLILRLITRGLVRSRRGPSRSARISVIACSWAVAIVRGGKSRLRAGAAAGGPQASGERQSVGIEVAGQCGVVHQPADRVVGA
jgi:hypothetical protein